MSGVKALAVEIDVELPGSSNRNDTDIARTAETVLESTTNWPNNTVKGMVEDGWITLTGELNYEFQKKLALTAVRHLMGVKGGSNQITIKSIPTPASI